MKVIMIETNKWSVEVKAKTKKQAIEKAQSGGGGSSTELNEHNAPAMPQDLKRMIEG